MQTQSSSSQKKVYGHIFEKYRKVINCLARYDLKMFDIPKTASILDVGCGFGDDIKQLKEHGYLSVSGVASDPYIVKKSSGLDIRLGEITRTNYPTESMDVILVDNVFHHIPDYSPALNEIHRILKSDGILCFIEPKNSFYRRGMDYITFKTPLPKIFGGPFELRYQVMLEEFKTGLYPQWLRSHNHFLNLLNKHFKILWLRKNAFFWFCKAQKIGQP